MNGSRKKWEEKNEQKIQETNAAHKYRHKVKMTDEV